MNPKDIKENKVESNPNEIAPIKVPVTGLPVSAVVGTETAVAPIPGKKSFGGHDNARRGGRGGHGGGRGGGGRSGAPRERVKPEFDSKIIDIRRVTRVAAGGRRYNFSVAVVAGDKKGRVGVGLGSMLVFVLLTVFLSGLKYENTAFFIIVLGFYMY